MIYTVGSDLFLLPCFCRHNLSGFGRSSNFNTLHFDALKIEDLLFELSARGISPVFTRKTNGKNALLSSITIAYASARVHLRLLKLAFNLLTVKSHLRLQPWRE